VTRSEKLKIASSAGLDVAILYKPELVVVEAAKAHFRSTRLLGAAY
jgi:hypothetical protein